LAQQLLLALVVTWDAQLKLVIAWVTATASARQWVVLQLLAQATAAAALAKRNPATATDNSKQT
jgi:hypothetical protein